MDAGSESYNLLKLLCLIMAPDDIFIQSSPCKVKFWLQSYTFYLLFPGLPKAPFVYFIGSMQISARTNLFFFYQNLQILTLIVFCKDMNHYLLDRYRYFKCSVADPEWFISDPALNFPSSGSGSRQRFRIHSSKSTKAK